METSNHYIYIFKPKRPDFLQTLTSNEIAAMGMHVEYTKKLFEKGVVILAGACSGGEYGMIILKADSQEEARNIFENDPAVKAGIVNAEFYPYKIMLLEKQPL